MVEKTTAPSGVVKSHLYIVWLTLQFATEAERRNSKSDLLSVGKTQNRFVTRRYSSVKAALVTKFLPARTHFILDLAIVHCKKNKSTYLNCCYYTRKHSARSNPLVQYPPAEVGVDVWETVVLGEGEQDAGRAAAFTLAAEAAVANASTGRAPPLLRR